MKLTSGLKKLLGTHESYAAIFDTPDGKRVLMHIAKVGNLTGTSFVAGDPSQTAFKEGQRHLALSILKFIGRDPNQIITLIQESMQNEDTDITQS